MSWGISMNFCKPAAVLLTALLVAACQPGYQHESVETVADRTMELWLPPILAGDHRSEANKHRDQYRHPLETLSFFGISEHDRVIEINPGGGWYMEILAPLLFAHGQYEIGRASCRERVRSGERDVSVTGKETERRYTRAVRR